MLDLSQTSLCTVLHDSGFKAFTVSLIQELSENNFDLV